MRSLAKRKLKAKRISQDFAYLELKKSIII